MYLQYMLNMHQLSHSSEQNMAKIFRVSHILPTYLSIATVRSECTTKQENKASYNTDRIVSDLTDFFDDY